MSIAYTTAASRQLEAMAVNPKVRKRDMAALQVFLAGLDTNKTGEDKGPHALGGRLLYFRPCKTIRVLVQQEYGDRTVLGFIIRSPKIAPTHGRSRGYTLAK